MLAQTPGLERAERPLPSPALSLLRLDLEQSPGRMPGIPGMVEGAGGLIG